MISSHPSLVILLLVGADLELVGHLGFLTTFDILVDSGKHARSSGGTTGLVAKPSCFSEPRCSTAALSASDQLL